MAMAAGWSWQDAGVIASADYAIDENEETMPELAFSASNLLVHQSSKSYDFHCFSRNDDAAESKADRLNRDVQNRVKFLGDRTMKAVAAATVSRSAQDRTSALIALGVFLHCQQDAWSHNGFGGNRLGHTWANIIGHSPDRPAERPIKAEIALKDAQAILQDFAGRMAGVQNAAIDGPQLRAAINDKRTLTVDAELFHLLPPASRQSEADPCVAGLSRRWSYVTLGRQKRYSIVPSQAIVAFLPTQFSYCAPLFAQYFGLKPEAEALMVVEPMPLYPQFDGAATPTVNADGSYGTLAGPGTFDHAIVNASVTASSVLGGGCRYDVAADLVNGGPSNAPAARIVGAIVGPDERARGSDSAPVAAMARDGSRSVPFRITSSEKDCSTSTAFILEVQPPPGQADRRWNDQRASNNRIEGLVKHAVPVPVS